MTDDLAPADWITSSTLNWVRLIEFGPSGFPAYARLRFLPADAEQPRYRRGTAR